MSAALGTSRPVAPFVEPLEPRRLLAADLTQIGLLVDGSASITPAQFGVFRTGIANAIDRVVPDGRVELSVVIFTGTDSLQTVVAPTLIDTPAERDLVESAVAGMTAQISTGTDYETALDAGTRLLTGSVNFSDATTQQLLMLTDGAPNRPGNTSDASQQAFAAAAAAVARAKNAEIDLVSFLAIGFEPGGTAILGDLASPQPATFVDPATLVLPDPITSSGFVIPVADFTDVEESLLAVFEAGGTSVRRPDLVPEAVFFSPNSLLAGDTIDVSLLLRNDGDEAARASRAVLRLTVDDTLTLYDRPLDPLRIDVPAIPRGESRTVNATLTIPAYTPADVYRLGFFADFDNSTFQSDRTNDSGVSQQTLSVAAPEGAVRPTITRQPAALTRTEGQAGTLSVSNDGTGPFGYEWYRDGRPIYGVNGPTLDFDRIAAVQAGNYYVRVSNAAGVVDSAVVPLTVTPRRGAPPAPTRPFNAAPGSTAFAVYPPVFDPNLPTIVISHGWQPKGDYSGTAELQADLTAAMQGRSRGEQPSVSWINTTAAAMRDRLAAEGRAANFVTFTWADAFTLSPFAASRSTAGAGASLAAALETRIGPGYAQHLQLVGHSFGSILSAYAVQWLGKNAGPDVDQVTILDAPAKVRLPVSLPISPLGLVGDTSGISAVDSLGDELIKTQFNGAIADFLTTSFPLYDSSFFYETLPSVNENPDHFVGYVDNYFGTLATGVDPLRTRDDSHPLGPRTAFGYGGFGQIIGGAAQAGGFVLPHEDHLSVPDFYLRTVRQTDLPGETIAGGGDVGFDLSGTLPGRYAQRPEPTTWFHDTSSDFAFNTVLPLINALNPIGDLPFVGNLSDTILTIGTQEVYGFLFSTGSNASSSLRVALPAGTLAAKGDTRTVAAFQQDLRVDDNAALLSLDFRVVDAAPGDYLQISFNDEVLFTFAADSFVGDEFQNVRLPMAPYAGNLGTLDVALVPADGNAQAVSSVEIGNLNLLAYDTPPATSVDMDLTDRGVLRIAGTPGDDDLLLEARDDGGLRVTANGLVTDFAPGDVLATVIDVGDGDDRVVLRDALAHHVVLGGSGDDTLDGSDAADVLVGQAGDDVLLGNAGDDHLLGNEGTDALDGGAGDDTLRGGLGDDALDGGEGTDAVSYQDRDADHPVNVTLNTTGGEAGETDSLAGFEQALGGDGDDLLAGDAGRNLLIGLAGDDTLRGMGGKDTLLGNDGADELDGGDDQDTLIALTGVFADNAPDRLIGGGGINFALADDDDELDLIGRAAFGSVQDYLEALA